MLEILKNKQIRYLFLSSFAVLFTGMGLFPLLPLYAAKFGATNSLIGVYFAIMYVANTLGPVVTAWLISRFAKRSVFIAGALVGLPALLLLGLAQNLVQVIILTSLVWFAGGVVMSLVSIFTGLYARDDSRGKAYSLMSMVGPLGALVGGAVLGQLVGRYGYPLMFLVLGLVWMAIPLIGWFGLKEAPAGQVSGAPVPSAGSTGALGAGFARLLAIIFLGSMSVNVSRLGVSLSMQAAHFSPEAISGASMLGGLAAIPFTLAIGALADRLGSKHFLFISYLLMLGSALLLVGAANEWQYWLASILSTLAFSVSGAMAQSLTGEVVPASALSKGLAWLGTFGAAANILCFAVGGLLFDLLGLPTVFLIAAGVALAAGVGVEGLLQARLPRTVALKPGAVAKASAD